MDTGKSNQRDFLVPEFVHSGRDTRARVSDKTRLKRLAAAVCAGLMAGAFSFLPTVEALRGGSDMPVLDSKDAAVSIVTNGNVMDINSAATNNVIKWVDFSISNGNTVDFHDQNYLNYVTGSARSDIYGIMKGTGNIYLVNPNGILIGDTARIDVGNLYLSTRNLTDDQLAAFTTNGTDPLVGSGTLTGDVINLGQLDANTVTVEGNNITFKNVAEVTKGGMLNEAGKIDGGTAHNGSSVKLTASGGEIHLGYANEAEATTVNETEYKKVNTPSLGWSIAGANPAYYMLVRNAYELQNMQNNLSGNYMLAGDIEMGGMSFTPIGHEHYDCNESTNYENKHTDAYAFKGNFDGLGYSVKNLTVNYDYPLQTVQRNEPKLDESDRPVRDEQGKVVLEIKTTAEVVDSGIGLFGYSKGKVESVRLEAGSISSTQGAVGIVGWNEGTVRQVYNDGLAVTGNRSVGGIVGSNFGTVKNVWNRGRVSGHFQVGGIAGTSAYSGVAIENAWNEGEVANDYATSNDYDFGGILGYNGSGTIQNVYNTGKVTGNNSVGGIVGNNSGGSTQIIQFAYNTGTIKANSANVGGIAGLNKSVIRNAYSKENSASALHGYNSGSVENAAIVAEADMMKAATFGKGDTGFGFKDGLSKDGVWRIYEGQTMPLLTAFMTKKDFVVDNTKVYNGTGEGKTGDAGAHYSASAQIGTGITQLGNNAINYVYDVDVIQPKALTVTGSIDKIYDGTANATLAAKNLSGVIEGENLTVSTTSASYSDKHAGENKTVTYKGLTLTGDTAKNYAIAVSGTGTGTITPAKVRFSVEDYIRDYDGTTDASEATLTKEGEIFKGDSLTSIKKEFTDKNAGDKKVIKVSGAVIDDGNGGNNYIVYYEENENSTIKRKELSLVADEKTVTQGAEAEFTGKVEGFVKDEGLENENDLAFTGDTTAEPGSHAITGTLKGKEEGEYGTNYKFANAAGNATALTINAKSEEQKPAEEQKPGQVNPAPATPASDSRQTPAAAEPAKAVSELPATTPVAPPAAAPVADKGEAEHNSTLGDVMPSSKGTPAANIPLETLREEENTAANLANESRNEAANVANVTREAGLEAGAQEAPFVMEEGTKPVEAAQMAGQEGNASDNGDSDSSDDEKKKKQQAAEE